jgi:hypothetical protein
MPRTAPLLGMVMSWAPLACAATIHPGLANVPALGTRPIADASVHDVVANGRDSCERGLGPGPLRYQLPPCRSVERLVVDSNVANSAPSAKGIVMPWVDHYYSRWPCASSKDEAGRMTLAHLALGPSYAASDGMLGSAKTCAGPL